jgi:hypothetical protein
MSTERIAVEPTRLTWFKSSYSGSAGGDCIEVAHTPHTIHVRDSKITRGPILRVSSEQWGAFVAYATTG